MYDMKPMAESLASQGRYGDSMLVHMNPVEVAGLRAAAQKMGGDLTTNPRTGQPEAFLPFLIGMGLQGLGMSALGAGIATGLGTAAITKDLGQGILAGLGAYGGAGIGEGLGAASSAAQATQAAPTASADLLAGASQSTAVPGSIGAGMTPTAAPASFAPIPGGPTPMPTDVMTGAGDLSMAQVGGTSVPGTPIGFTQPVPPPSSPSMFAEPLAAGRDLALSPPSQGSLAGLEAVTSTGPTGEAARQAFMQNVGGGSGLLTKTAYGIAPYAIEKAFEQPEFNAPEDNSLIRPYDYDPTTRRFTAREPYRAPGPEYMAQGGLAGLTGYKEGNILRGQGDGMSDEIKASIDGEQDVLLSDGEYVVPADAVAMLGNGSTDAGANRLDAMIARLRTQKYGRNKQPPEMKAESVMPA
jgi:hypothetical protein